MQVYIEKLKLSDNMKSKNIYLLLILGILISHLSYSYNCDVNITISGQYDIKNQNNLVYCIENTELQTIDDKGTLVNDRVFVSESYNLTFIFLNHINDNRTIDDDYIFTIENSDNITIKNLEQTAISLLPNLLFVNVYWDSKAIEQPNQMRIYIENCSYDGVFFGGKDSTAMSKTKLYIKNSKIYGFISTQDKTNHIDINELYLENNYFDIGERNDGSTTSTYQYDSLYLNYFSKVKKFNNITLYVSIYQTYLNNIGEFNITNSKLYSVSNRYLFYTRSSININLINSTFKSKYGGFLSISINGIEVNLNMINSTIERANTFIRYFNKVYVENSLINDTYSFLSNVKDYSILKDNKFYDVSYCYVGENSLENITAYNNYFDCNFYFNSNANFTTDFNTTLNMSRLNIINQYGYGGNYYKGYSEYCIDNDKNGICDNPKSISSNGKLKDYIPIAYLNKKPNIYVNPDITGSYELNESNVTLTTNISSTDDTDINYTLAIFKNTTLLYKNTSYINNTIITYDFIFDETGYYIIEINATDNSNNTETYKMFVDIYKTYTSSNQQTQLISNVLNETGRGVASFVSNITFPLGLFLIIMAIVSGLIFFIFILFKNIKSR